MGPSAFGPVDAQFLGQNFWCMTTIKTPDARNSQSVRVSWYSSAIRSNDSAVLLIR